MELKRNIEPDPRSLDMLHCFSLLHIAFPLPKQKKDYQTHLMILIVTFTVGIVTFSHNRFLIIIICNINTVEFPWSYTVLFCIVYLWGSETKVNLFLKGGVLKGFAQILLKFHSWTKNLVSLWQYWILITNTERIIDPVFISFFFFGRSQYFSLWQDVNNNCNKKKWLNYSIDFYYLAILIRFFFSI